MRKLILISLLFICSFITSYAQQVLGDFTGGDTSEWPKVVWYRDTGNNWDEGLLKNSSSQSYLGRAGFGIHMHESRMFTFWSTNWNPLLSVQGGTGNIYIRGNIGLGTINPQGKLHVNAPLNDNISSIKIGGTASGNINVPVGESTGHYSIDFHTWRDVNPDQIGASIKAFRINSYQANNALIQSMDLSFSTSGGYDQSDLKEKMRIKADGNVGIGTSSPDAKLAVNGTVHAKEIKVDTNFPVPDNVFEKGYKLRSLIEVESYIKLNSHLPEIAGAAEMKKNGVLQSEMNMQLLKKIEELTLYVIELKKESRKQELQILKLKKESTKRKKKVRYNRYFNYIQLSQIQAWQ